MIGEEVMLDRAFVGRTRHRCVTRAALDDRTRGELTGQQRLTDALPGERVGDARRITDKQHTTARQRGGRHAGGNRPRGVSVLHLEALAERLDTLAGGFASGLKPSGNKDPFALRRNALGLARTLIEGGLDLNLVGMLDAAKAALPAGLALDTTELYDFILDRLRSYFADRGVGAALFDAVAATKPVSLADFAERLAALQRFAELPEAAALAAANKRARNILKKVEGALPEAIDASKLVEPAERELHAALVAALADTDASLAARDYVAVLSRLALLRAPVDAFFDGVMVMAEDAAVRDNRLALLKALADRFAAVAAIEQLAA